ncbi:ImmA/IrrE family metallo-endopeptidase [Sporosarcina sp. ANT_H38]|uniref:ImmA/IrrE family metallo-endopeptidase n=1 Tax=Sporosarcina sp. ANT_H38 TaxID=2597358 RepID=UPI0011F1B32A|nr:ImmA/IrrE family metallo-endopeptidase [Sporosarcina sp. ANT_H38]KAA0941579.1 ImmA/IrrE family metallo-endopeptidase [Sporosarcina sp. ANT_H38]
MRTHLEDYIYSLYKSIDITNPAELDISLIAKEIGVEIVYKENAFRFDNEIVLVRGTKREEWIQFGHEVCHYLRHSGNQLNMNPLFMRLQEWQAESFMYHFCIPSFMLHELDLPSDRNIAIWEIQKSFNVSREFAELRLEKFMQQKESRIVFSRAIGF